MKIYIKSAAEQPIPASLQVKRIGKYLYNHIDGAFNFKSTGNTFDVWITLLYQLKPEIVRERINQQLAELPDKNVNKNGDIEWKFCPFCGDSLDELSRPCEYCRKPEVFDDVSEMTINVNITTYQNKLRVNTIECDPLERTLGFDLFLPEKLTDLRKASDMIMAKVIKRIKKGYKDYITLFE